MLELILDKLGQSILVQAAFALVILTVGPMVLMRGFKDRKGDDSQVAQDTHETRMFFNGPVDKIIDSLDGLYRETREQRNDQGKAETFSRERHKEHMDVMRDIVGALSIIGTLIGSNRGAAPRRRKRKT